MAVRKKTQFITDLKNGSSVDDLFAVCDKQPPRQYTSSGKTILHFDVTVSDRTGYVAVKFWGREDTDATKRVFDSFSKGDVVEIKGRVGEYKGRPQISITQNEGTIQRWDGFDPIDFVHALENNEIERLYSRLKNEITDVKDQQLQRLLKDMFDDQTFAQEYKMCPSAMTNHHNYVGGNLQHTIHVIELCKLMCAHYSEIRKDLLICGAVLHDVGKIKEYESGLAISQTRIGGYIGHPVLGDRLVRKTIEKISAKTNFPKDLEDELSHMILSHHGRIDWGSPVEPKTVEAWVLHYADLLDSHVKNFMQKNISAE